MVFAPISCILLFCVLLEQTPVYLPELGGEAITVSVFCALYSPPPSALWYHLRNSLSLCLMCPEQTQCQTTIPSAWIPYFFVMSPCLLGRSQGLFRAAELEANPRHTTWHSLSVSHFCFLIQILWLHPVLFCDYSTLTVCQVTDTITRRFVLSSTVGPHHCPLGACWHQEDNGDGSQEGSCHSAVTPLTVPGYFTLCW